MTQNLTTEPYFDSRKTVSSGSQKSNHFVIILTEQFFAGFGSVAITLYKKRPGQDQQVGSPIAKSGKC